MQIIRWFATAIMSDRLFREYLGSVSLLSGADHEICTGSVQSRSRKRQDVASLGRMSWIFVFDLDFVVAN